MRETTTQYDLGAVKVRKRVHLPHRDVEHGIYFVTWNLIDAIPAHVREELRMQRAYEIERVECLRGDYSIGEKHAIEAAIRRAYEKELDKGAGQCLLKDPRCATLVADALQYFDDVKYRQYSWSVMPNHAHAVFSCVPPYTIDEVLHSWKSFTSKEIGKVLGMRGTIWQGEYFDHSIRGPDELQRTIEYVAQNPATAGLRDWPWSRVYPDRIAAVV
jgi:REP element-mobilizing transposase RayT